ncbi:MAG: 5-formyltetrahydrofolate cyclo-ligase, partial [Acidiferrobacterales bacterium]
MTVNTSKAELRRVLRAQRAALSFEQQATAAMQLAAHVADTVFFKASQRIACYLPIKGEINPRPIIEQIWALGKLCYLPIVPQEPH